MDLVPENTLVYDAAWWDKAGGDQREGFFWGASDCLQWDAHLSQTFFGSDNNMTAPAFDREITKYYSAHPADRKLAVIDVWKQTSAAIDKDTPRRDGGEVYTNPHGFLNGNWYRQVSWHERYGFLNGYLGCLRAYTDQSKLSYPRSVAYYAERIWNYVQTHPGADDESLADILARFREKTIANR